MSLLKRRIGNYIFIFNKKYHQTQQQVQQPVVVSGGPVFKNVQNFPDRTALTDRIATYSYANIFMSASDLSKEITKLVNGRTNERVLFMCSNDANYVITLWAIWMSGQIGKKEESHISCVIFFLCCC